MVAICWGCNFPWLCIRHRRQCSISCCCSGASKECLVDAVVVKRFPVFPMEALLQRMSQLFLSPKPSPIFLTREEQMNRATCCKILLGTLLYPGIHKASLAAPCVFYIFGIQERRCDRECTIWVNILPTMACGIWSREPAASAVRSFWPSGLLFFELWLKRSWTTSSLHSASMCILHPCKMLMSQRTQPRV